MMTIMMVVIGMIGMINFLCGKKAIKNRRPKKP